MKKFLIMTCALCVLTGAAANAAEKVTVKKDVQRPNIERKAPNPEEIQKIRKAHEASFEKKLGLTEVQKLKARELRKNGHAKIKPVMDDLRAKRQEAEKIRQSNLTVQEQEEQLTAIDKEIATLQKNAQKIRKQNMKDFEAILTRDQKKTLKNMKKEGRQNYRRVHEQLPPPPCKPNEVK